MSVDLALTKTLQTVEERLYDEPISREMLSDVAQYLTFAVDQLEAIIRDGHEALRCEQAVRLATARCRAACDGLSWLEGHPETEQTVRFEQLHVVFQEVHGTVVLLHAAAPA